MKKIVLTGGGTAGHVFPALAIRERLPKYVEVVYIGSHGMEKEIVQKEKDITFFEIGAVKLERKITLKNLFIPFKLLSSIRKAKRILRDIKPDIIFSKGGFVALPVVIAGKKLGINVVSHESDLSMGLANKIILKYCDKMCVTFEKTCSVSDKCVFTGQPIRKVILTGRRNQISSPQFLTTKKNLLIFGGSLGAKFINNLIEDNIKELTKKYNVFHVTGKNNGVLTKRNGYVQTEFCSNMGDALAWADVVVSRAGSGAINELLALKKPMLLIPLSKSCSRGDQIENAKLFKELGYCELLEEENCDNELFLLKLEKLVKNDKFFIKNMEKSKKVDACDKIVEILNSLTTKNKKEK